MSKGKKQKALLANLDRLGYLNKLEEVLIDHGFPSVAPHSVRETLEAQLRTTIDFGVALKKALVEIRKKDREISELKVVVAKLRESIQKLEELLAAEQKQRHRVF
jgi:hypothetical protein